MNETFWDVVCGTSRGLSMLFVIASSLLVFTLVALPWLEPGTGSYVVAVLDVGILAVVIALIGAVLLICRNR